MLAKDYIYVKRKLLKTSSLSCYFVRKCSVLCIFVRPVPAIRSKPVNVPIACYYTPAITAASCSAVPVGRQFPAQPLSRHKLQSVIPGPISNNAAVSASPAISRSSSSQRTGCVRCSTAFRYRQEGSRQAEQNRRYSRKGHCLRRKQIFHLFRRRLHRAR